MANTSSLGLFGKSAASTQEIPGAGAKEAVRNLVERLNSIEVTMGQTEMQSSSNLAATARI